MLEHRYLLCRPIRQSRVLCGESLASQKKPAHPSDKLPEWLALNSPFHFPLRRTSYVPPVWPQIMEEAFSMMGEAHERTNITRGRTVKNLYLASGFARSRGMTLGRPQRAGLHDPIHQEIVVPTPTLVGCTI